MNGLPEVIIGGLGGLNVKILYDWLKGKRNGYHANHSAPCSQLLAVIERVERHLETDKEILQRLTRIETMIEDRLK